MFKRKVYDKLLQWKSEWSGTRACLLEGARRVGKSTIAESFAENEYKSYVVIDFANITDDLLDVFNSIANLDVFFLRLQAETGTRLYERASLIIFDEIQLYPKARQAIKYLVKDGRYDYLSTGSLISIKKNVEGIVIPSEEIKIQVYPMDYEEFLWALDKDYDIIRTINDTKRSIGDATNRSLMRDYRVYMAVGGMPQAVDSYLKTNNLEHVDKVKREIINLYMDDIRKLDRSGRTSDIFGSIPGQLASNKKRFVISAATGKQKVPKDEERFFDIVDSKTVLPCYNVSKPGSALMQYRQHDIYKLYLADIGLFVTMMFNSGEVTAEKIYKKLLSDKLDENLGYLYENAVAQSIVACGHDLYYHTWRKEGSTHSYEIDFLVASASKVNPIEVKASATTKHASIDNFKEKYGKYIGSPYIFSQKDFSNDKDIILKPIYTIQAVLENF
ncbi:ATP-binding protein [Eubacterium xylanophilum]|uniref:ATP-binding protein n=1 Tax=Eubacterium xylanophilum TaxID=39497 RepID=UPI00047D98D0|nr:AAA family ATPase [Eubacterium xylanophilum]